MFASEIFSRVLWDFFRFLLGLLDSCVSFWKLFFPLWLVVLIAQHFLLFLCHADVNLPPLPSGFLARFPAFRGER